jgi:hypothetical protein
MMKRLRRWHPLEISADDDALEMYERGLLYGVWLLVGVQNTLFSLHRAIWDCIWTRWWSAQEDEDDHAL